MTSPNGCGSGSYGSAGNRCISDRDRGGQWDWFSYYRDPIATASVTPNSACLGTTVSGSGIQTDVANDMSALLPGSQSRYLQLIYSGGGAGVLPSAPPGAAPSAAVPGLPPALSSLFAGYSSEQLFIGGLAAAVAVAVMLQ